MQLRKNVLFIPESKLLSNNYVKKAHQLFTPGYYVLHNNSMIGVSETSGFGINHFTPKFKKYILPNVSKRKIMYKWDSENS